MFVINPNSWFQLTDEWYKSKFQYAEKCDGFSCRSPLKNEKYKILVGVIF